MFTGPPRVPPRPGLPQVNRGVPQRGGRTRGGARAGGARRDARSCPSGVRQPALGRGVRARRRLAEKVAARLDA